MTLLLALLLAAPADLADRPPRCGSLYQEGRRQYFEGRFAEARAGFHAAQECAREEWGREDTLSQRYEGLCFQYEDRLAEALAVFRAAASAIEAEERAAGWSPPKPSSSLADALNNVGRVLHLQGEYAAARAELERALALAPDVTVGRAVGVWIRGRVLTNLAITTAALGDASSAHRTLGEVVAAPSGDRMNRTRALEHLGRLEESWGDLEAALARYEEALATGEAALREDAPVPYNRAYLVGALSRVGLLRQRLGRTAAAVEALDRALATARELGTRQLVADVLLDRGVLARESGDLHAALASHEEALALAVEARLEVALARALGELGWDRLAGGDPAAALALFERALDSKAARESPEIAGALRSGIARARERLGETGPAAEQDDLAVDAIESVRLGTLSEARRLGFWRVRQGVFRSAIALRHRLLVDSGGVRHAERALELAEQARSRTLLDLVSRGVVPVGSEGAGRAWTVERLRAGLLAGDVGIVAFSLDEPRSWAWVLTRDACAMAALPGRGEDRARGTELAPSGRVGQSLRPVGPRRGDAPPRVAPLSPRGPPRLAAPPRDRRRRRPAPASRSRPSRTRRGRLLLERHVVSYAPSASVAGRCTRGTRPRGRRPRPGCWPTRSRRQPALGPPAPRPTRGGRDCRALPTGRGRSPEGRRRLRELAEAGPARSVAATVDPSPIRWWPRRPRCSGAASNGPFPPLMKRDRRVYAPAQRVGGRAQTNGGTS